MDGPRWGVDRGEKRGTRPRKTWEDQKTAHSTEEAYAVAALKGSEFSGLRVLILAVHVLESLELGAPEDQIGTWSLDVRILHAAKERGDRRGTEPTAQEGEGRNKNGKAATDY
jgi:hypothetical protein